MLTLDLDTARQRGDFLMEALSAVSTVVEPGDTVKVNDTEYGLLALCFVPSLMQLAVFAQNVKVKEDTTFADCDEFVADHMAKLHQCLEECRCAAMDILTEACVGKEGILNFLDSVSALFVATCVNLTGNATAELENIVLALSDSDRYKPNFMDKLDSIDDDTEDGKALRKFIEKADSDEFKALLDTFARYWTPAAREAFQTALENGRSLMPQTKRVVHCLTVVQCLYKPLQLHETRSELAHKCKIIVKDLPETLPTLLDAAAGRGGGGDIEAERSGAASSSGVNKDTKGGAKAKPKACGKK